MAAHVHAEHHVVHRAWRARMLCRDARVAVVLLVRPDREEYMRGMLSRWQLVRGLTYLRSVGGPRTPGAPGATPSGANHRGRSQP